ncbi:MAG: hypothetical protein K6G54_07965 [Oscillospiraceae bacterium]|nr:hypothetical protein [Oscillospiraceae bacterium]
MRLWAEKSEKDGKRLHAAAEHQGVGVFADVGARDLLRFAVGVSTTLGVLRARKRHAKRLRKEKKRR